MDEIKEYEGSMRTDEKGNLMIASKDAFDQFFKDNPGASFTYKIIKTSQESRKKMFAYYFAEVVPKVQKGWRNLGEVLSKEETINRLKYVGATCRDGVINDKKLEVVGVGDNQRQIVVENVREVYELNYFELRRHIQEVIIFAAQELETIIEEPI